jgi:di/tricarboxylate transporter
MAVVSALVLFATELVSVDVTAIGILAALLLVGLITQGLADADLIGEPLYVLCPPDADLSVALDSGLSGFASTATITVLAMLILSEGVQ